MSKGRKSKTARLIEDLIQTELETRLAKLVRRARKRATKEVEKLNQVPRLEYHRDEGFVEADYQEMPKEEEKAN